MTYAQHFGVPTRMLDFSTNPLVALYFACCDSNKDEDGSVWAINRDHYVNWFKQGYKGSSKKFTDNDVINYILADMGYISEKSSDFDFVRPYIRSVPYVDRRMAAQSSVFLIWTSQKESLDSMISTGNFYPYKSDVLHKVVDDIRFLSVMKIVGEFKYRILQELNQVGINQATLFPGLDGSGNHIRELMRRDPRDLNI